MANNLYDFVTIEAQQHQEALERQGFYTDDTPVGPLEDELKNINSPLALQYANWLRTKQHGSDILESQARWGLLMAKQALDAIEQSGDAKRVANDLTERFNQQIGALTEDSEVIDARGGKVNLGQRLDETDAQLAQTMKKGDLFKNVTDYGVIPDGVTNNTVALQSMLNIGGHIYFPEGEYLFDKIVIEKDNTTLEFADNVKLLSSYNGDNLRVGSIEIKGADNFSTSVTMDIQENSSKLIVSDITGLAVGDFLTIKQSNPSSNDIISHKQKYIYTVCTIKSINPNTKEIIVNESIPHAYQALNNIVATKITPVKNVKIIGKNTLFDKMGTTEYANHVYLKNVYNFEISGFVFENGGGKGLSMEYVHTFNISNIEHRKPSNITSGHGYGVHVSTGSCYGNIENSYFTDSRHAIDFSNGSNNCRVVYCKGFKADISGHGQNTKHILIESCSTYGAGFGVGNYTFLSDEKWQFINCKVFDHSLSGNAFNIAAQSHDIDIINCSVFNSTYAVTISGGKNINIQQLKVDFVIGSVILIREQSNGIIINNCFARSDRVNAAPAIDIIDESRNISITDSDIETSNRDIVRVGLSANVTNLTINKCRFKTNHTATTKYCIISEAKGVYVENTFTESRVQLLHIDGVYKFNNNVVSDWVQIYSTKNTMVMSNFGVSSNWIVPTHNGADLVILNNVIALV